MSRKNGPLPPRRKRMARRGRLQAARHWLPNYEGKNLVRGYAKWFGVNLWCAVLELRMLGVEVDPGYADEIWASQNKPKTAKSPTEELSEGYGTEWDEDFSYIAGFTSGGAPFGTPWET